VDSETSDSDLDHHVTIITAVGLACRPCLLTRTLLRLPLPKFVTDVTETCTTDSESNQSRTSCFSLELEVLQDFSLARQIPTPSFNSS
jgi:hypothetical protein